MLGAGTVLALLGMSVVFVFLILLILVIHISSRILASETAGEMAALTAETQPRQQTGLLDRSSRQIAAISAAIAAHRAARTRG
jgi:sodium pump decarboxylase gamma subunit